MSVGVKQKQSIWNRSYESLVMSLLGTQEERKIQKSNNYKNAVNVNVYKSV